MRFGLKQKEVITAIAGVVLTALVFGRVQVCQAGEPVPGSAQMPIRYIGTAKPVLDYPDGALRLAVTEVGDRRCDR